MYRFRSKSKQGLISPVNDSKRRLFKKLLKHYEDNDITFEVIIQEKRRSINESQVGLYRAFIAKSADEFGVSFGEMEDILKPFYPTVLDHNDNEIYVPVSNWTNYQLDSFIDKATATMADHGFKF